MRIEEEVFQKMTVDRARLLPYGFRQEEGAYYYTEPFLDGAFRAELRIDENGVLSGRVMDLATGEEYLPIYVEAHSGAFVGAVRAAYRELLGRLAAACFIRHPFRQAQANRIAGLLEQKYGERPDYPFARLPDCGVFRYPGNRKWYGLVLSVQRSRLPGQTEQEDDPLLELLNLKVGREKNTALQKLPSVYPAYHMKHPDWASIVLDGSLPDETIMELLAISRDYAIHAGKARSASAGSTSWIVPANPRFFDLEAAFRQKDEIIWKQSSDIRVGDTVYLYVAAPVSAIRYRCRVLAVDIPYQYEDEALRIKRVMKLQRLETYAPERFRFQKLREFGITSIRGPRRANEAFLREAAGSKRKKR